jgi:hypothetical protein
LWNTGIIRTDSPAYGVSGRAALAVFAYNGKTARRKPAAGRPTQNLPLFVLHPRIRPTDNVNKKKVHYDGTVVAAHQGLEGGREPTPLLTLTYEHLHL